MTSANLIKLWELPGGVHPPENKTQSTQLPLGSLPLPAQLIIPLNQHIGAPAKAVVAIGERVLKGQLIAAADGTFSANVHASTSGVVNTIGVYPLAHPSGMSGECIVIAADGKDQWISLEACDNYLALDRVALLDKIRAAGVAGLGGAGFPTSVKLHTKSTQIIDTLIINGAECEPYITADDMLMQNRAHDIIAGSYLISHILHHPKRIVIGVEDNKPKAIASLRTALQNFTGTKAGQDAAIEIASIPTKYPSGGAKQLIQILTGREIPHGHHSADIGATCVNVGTVVAAWRAVRYGEPLISRVTTVVGESLSTQRNIDALIGTPIDYVLAQHGFDASKASRVIMGGSMMGFTLHDLRAPLVKTTNCILAPSKKEAPLPPPAQACIRCGLCAEACPATLLPQQLFWYAQAEDTERLQAHHIFDCIECGACSYVCPSKIPLVQYYRAAKGNIRQQVAEKEKADRSRQRFEFRQERFAKEEAAKEAKRVARQKAAEEARQKLAEQKLQAANQTENAVPELESNLVVAAVAKASSFQLSIDEQKSKLERMLAAAQSSLVSAKAPLIPRKNTKPITEEQFIQQKARIKQAELKVAEAEKKLADFIANNSDTLARTEAKPATSDIADAPVNPTDAIAAVMARAQAKLNQSPEEKLRSNLDALQARLIKAQEKAEQAIAENNPSAAALQKGVEKMREKIADVQAELDALLAEPVDLERKAAEQSAAEKAMVKAKEKAAAMAAMSDEEKQAQQRRALESRLQKAKERLQQAEAENDPHTETFRLAVNKLEEKLSES